MSIKRNIARIATLVVVSVTSGTRAEPPTITSVTAQQRYPWNGKVDISYTVTGDIAEEAKQRAVLTSLKVSAIDRIANTTNVATQLSGDLSLAEGTHSIVWDMDAEGFPLPFKSSNMVFNVSCEITPATYCVIDLSGGANATSYPITYMAEPPNGGFNVDEYKTTKLVLRRIEAGTFIMGDDQTDESHRVTLTKPFFCGIFEMTQRQYELVTGSNPCYSTYGKGDACPVYFMSYNTIRGTSEGTKWPSSSAVDYSSFMGKLQARTGLDFDLPTEAQWEYACRAGTTTTYSYGNMANGDYMWYDSNSGSQTHVVGTKNPNPWGLYDMHGNVWEWCLDWYGRTLTYGYDPKGAAAGDFRVSRGGCWCWSAGWSTSSRRSFYETSNNSYCFGFRLVRTLSNAGDEQGLDVLCFGGSKMECIDITSDTRKAAPTEQIYYSSGWENGAGTEATAVVMVNGAILKSAIGSGYVDWTPMSNGTYTLTHKVMSGGVQIGETLTATFLAAVLTATQTTEVPVPYSWLRQYCPGISDEYEAYEASAKATAENGHKVWECYVLGLDPREMDVFRITSFPMKSDGTPDFDNLTIYPPKSQWNVPGATQVVKGAATLDGEWQTVTEENKAGFRFFKVVVEVP